MTTVTGGYVGGCSGGGESFGLMSRLQGYESYCCSEVACLGYDLVAVSPMAEEDESRTESVNEAGSSSKDVQDERDEGWLQLGIGSHQLDQSTTRTNRLIELDLLPGGVRSLPPPVFRAPRPVSSTSFLLQQPLSISQHHHHQEINWAFRPIPRNITVAAASPSSSSSSLLPPGSYFTRPFQLHPGVDVPAGPSLDFRIVDPPRRPHSGVWFMLQASQNQSKEPFLPQISKSYLRIKDGRMTVRLLMKYLVNKLRLDSESEIEITCRGQQLSPFLTLQHVRDNIWSPRDPLTLLPDSSSSSSSSSTSDHLMVLHYARSA